MNIEINYLRSSNIIIFQTSSFIFEDNFILKNN